MADELIDIVDVENNLTRNVRLKSEAHKNGLWHRAAHIWIYNSKGEVLLQLRAKDKILYPDVWDASAAGHISAGEEVIISALREVEEEIGLTLVQDDLEFIKINKFKSDWNGLKNYEFHYIYFYKYDGDISGLIIQKEELQEIKFFDINKVIDDVKNDSPNYVINKDYWLFVMDEIKKRV